LLSVRSDALRRRGNVRARSTFTREISALTGEKSGEYADCRMAEKAGSRPGQRTQAKELIQHRPRRDARHERPADRDGGRDTRPHQHEEQNEYNFGSVLKYGKGSPTN